ncbi:hypothetical protein C8A03DRAFT_39279, partial [Achaetomium macrosporum]
TGSISLIPSLAPRALQFARDLAKRTLVRRVALGLTALKWLTSAINLVLDEVGDDDPTEAGGGGPVISVVIPVTPTTTPIVTPHSTRPCLLPHSQMMTEIVEDGGVIFGFLTLAKEKSIGAYGLLDEDERKAGAMGAPVRREVDVDLAGGTMSSVASHTRSNTINSTGSGGGGTESRLATSRFQSRAALNYPGWDSYTLTRREALRRWGCVDRAGNPDPPDAEEGYHGTEMAALIGGHVSGVNPHVNLVPLRSGPYGKSRVHHAVAAMAQIEKLQTQNGGQHAIVSASFGYKKDTWSPGYGQPTQTLFSPSPTLTLTTIPKGTSTKAVDYSPDWLGGDHAGDKTPIFAIGVGNCDINGNRAPASSFLYDTAGTDPTNHKYPELYNIGSGLVVPTLWMDPEDGTFERNWAARGGTSHATALASGLLSLLIARDPGTFNSAGAPTKQGLQSLARRKKGSAWPPDSPDTAGWIAPRAATDWEIQCNPAGTNVPGPDRPDLRDLTAEEGVDLTVDVLAGPAEYQKYLVTAPCVYAPPGRSNPPI